jgi:hypothetical protein
MDALIAYGGDPPQVLSTKQKIEQSMAEPARKDEMRTDPAAEVEIRLVFDKAAQMVKCDYPLVFQDFERKELADGTGQWKPSLRSKV